MKSNLTRCLAVVLGCMLVALIYAPCAPVASASHNAILWATSKAKEGYDRLDKEDKDIIGSALTSADKLDPHHEKIMEIVSQNLLDTEEKKKKVEERIGSDPEKKLCEMAVDALKCVFREPIEGEGGLEYYLTKFTNKWAETIRSLLTKNPNDPVTIDNIWEVLQEAERILPDTMKDITWQDVLTLYHEGVVQFLTDKSKEALNLAAKGTKLESALAELGWKIGDFVEIKDAIRDQGIIDNGKAAEQCLVKGYLRSVTRINPQLTTMYVGDQREVNLLVMNKLEVSGSTTGLAWESDDETVVEFVKSESNGKVYARAKKAGSTVVTAYHQSAGKGRGWIVKSTVTVRERPREREPEWVPPTLPAQPTPEGVDLSGSARRATTTRPDGTTACTVSLDTEAFRTGLEADPSATNLIVDAMEDVDEREILVPGDGLELLAQRGASLTIRTTEGNLIIPAGAIDAGALAQQLGADPSKVQIRVSIRRVPQDEANRAKEKAATITGLAPIGEVVEIAIEATADGQSVEIVAAASPNGAMPQAPWAVASAGAVPVPAAKAQAIKCEIPYTAEQVAGVKDVRKLGAYRFEEAAQTWEYVRSTVDAANRKVTFFSPARGKYCVMAYEKTFADIAGHWAQEDIELMASKHVVKGIAPDSAGPDLTVTRAQFAALLSRALGLGEASSEAARFSDVAPGAWYAGVVGAAAQAGLVKGYDDGTFGPEKPITRAEMAVVLSRAQQAYGDPIAVTSLEAERTLARFADSAAVPDWARRDMARAIIAELIRGVEVNKLEPGGLATRAQAITVTRRMMEKFGML